MKKISCIVPCYCSEQTIGNVIARTEYIIRADGRYDYEIICVNDGSSDATYEVLQKLASKTKKIKVVNLARNFGQHAAVLAGLHYITGDIVLCLDDDGETPPEQLFTLINTLESSKFDVVSARYESDDRDVIRKIGTKISMFMSHTMINMPNNVELNSYFCMKRFVADNMILYPNPYPFIAGLIFRTTRNVGNVFIERKERLAGKSNYNFSRLLGLWLNGFTAFSEKPLRAASIIGVIFASIGLLETAILIMQRLIGGITVSGYTSIMSAILISSGLIMLFLGLLGEYIGRMYICLNKSPQYVVRELLNIKEDSHAENISSKR